MVWSVSLHKSLGISTTICVPSVARTGARMRTIASSENEWCKCWLYGHNYQSQKVWFREMRSSGMISEEYERERKRSPLRLRLWWERLERREAHTTHQSAQASKPRRGPPPRVRTDSSFVRIISASRCPNSGTRSQEIIIVHWIIMCFGFEFTICDWPRQIFKLISGCLFQDRTNVLRKCGEVRIVTVQ